MYRLSGFDASMLTLEAPTVPMTGCALWKLDWSTVPGGYRFETFRDALAERLPALPEFRMKLADSVLNVDTPVWVDDPDFDLDRHLHRVRLPAPGTRSDLMLFLEDLLAQRMDRTKPLWDMWVIEGLADTDPDFSDGVAVMHRLHHAMVDGLSALDILSRLCSTTADAPPPQARDGAGTVNTRDLVLDGLAGVARRPWHLLTKVLPMVLGGVVKTARRAAVGQTMPGILRTPRTPFNGSVSERRRMAYTQLNLADVRTVKDTTGGTVNDVVLTVVAGALRRYLIDRAALPESTLIAAMPVSVQSNLVSRNNLSFMLSRLYTDIADPVDRLKAITASNSIAKQHTSAIGPTLLLDLMQFAPGLLALGMRLYRRSGLSDRWPVFNLTVSNTPPPNDQFYLMGAGVRARFAFGPVFHGAGLAITVISLNGNLDIGVVGCADLVPDVWDIADGLSEALRELVDATGVTQPTRGYGAQ